MLKVANGQKRFVRILSKALGDKNKGVSGQITLKRVKPTTHKFSLRHFNPEADFGLYDNPPSPKLRNKVRERPEKMVPQPVVTVPPVESPIVVKEEPKEPEPEKGSESLDWDDRFMPHHFINNSR